MTSFKLYYATNRNHEGKDQWKPDSYGTKFGNDGMENLRFGFVTLTADDKKISKFLNTDMKECGNGDGEGLSGYLSKCAKSAKIMAYDEKIDKNIVEADQKKIKLGSAAAFSDLQSLMLASSDVLVYIHGFNVSWNDAVGSALSLQIMLKNKRADEKQNVVVVLFTWPSDGMALPLVSYKSDRTEARGSGAAVGRALLKTRDFLVKLRRQAKGKQGICDQDIHLLCHSMGNYLLQEVLQRISDYTPGNALPRIFEHVFLCAPDVDDDTLELGQPLNKVDQIANSVTIYHNKGDVAMVVSDYTKGNPERLGRAGAAHPGSLHNKVHQVDCTPVVSGFVEHGYYLVGNVISDIRCSIDGWEQNDGSRKRYQSDMQNNVWEMEPENL